MKTEVLVEQWLVENLPDKFNGRDPNVVVRTFEDVGMLTNDCGLVVEFKDENVRYQISIRKCR